MGIVFAFTEHPFLGWMIAPYLFRLENNFIKLEQRIHKLEEAKQSSLLSDDVRQAVEICLETTEQAILERINLKKGIPSKTYFEKHFNDAAYKRARQIIENNMLRVVEIAGQGPAFFLFYDRAKSFLIDQVIKIMPEEAETVYNFEKNEEGTRYHLSIASDGAELTLLDKANTILAESPCLLISDNKLYRFSEDVNGKNLRPFFDKEFIQVPLRSEKMYFKKFILKSIKEHPVRIKGFEVHDKKTAPQPHLRLQNGFNGPILSLEFSYGKHKILHTSPQKEFVRLHIDDEHYSFSRISRKKETEEKLIQILTKHGLRFSKHSNSFEAIHGNSEVALIQWVNQNRTLLEKHKILFTQELNKKYYIGEAKAEQRINKKNDWFDVYIQIVLQDGTTINFTSLRNYILEGRREYKLKDGSIFLIPQEWMERFHEVLLHGKLKKDHFEMPLQLFSIIDALEQGPQEIKSTAFAPPEEFLKLEAPAQLKAKLRSYQLDGFRWMEWLRSRHFGGILADDMGLGKTIQALSSLLKIKEEADQNQVHKIHASSPKPSNSPQLELFATAETTENTTENEEPSCHTSLIIAPASLMHNWKNEIRRFAPTLSYYIYTGSARVREADFLKEFDIVLSTYGTIRNDMEILENFPFQYLILDESQNIKNPSSKTYKSIMRLTANYRLTLTGTPIENSISDLWAQLNFLNPGILGNQAFFREQYIIPIEKHGDEALEENLQSLIRPFVLRRTKQQAAPELPPLTEETIMCEMSSEQKKMYEREKSRVRNLLLEDMDQKTSNQNNINVLQGISLLRQISNHPLMVDDDFEHGSGKMKIALSMLENIINEGHKVLVFSSYVKHLELYARELKKRGKDYAMLTGASRQREKIIQRFQNEQNCSVFLISLKAGGVGLNLQQADYVFILDPWWNPASEEQALSRTYRMGQQRNVFVYRFLTRGSIEEKIARLQERKIKFASLIKTREGIQELLAEPVADTNDG